MVMVNQKQKERKCSFHEAMFKHQNFLRRSSSLLAWIHICYEEADVEFEAAGHHLSAEDDLASHRVCIRHRVKFHCIDVWVWTLSQTGLSLLRKAFPPLRFLLVQWSWATKNCIWVRKTKANKGLFTPAFWNDGWVARLPKIHQSFCKRYTFTQDLLTFPSI